MSEKQPLSNRLLQHSRMWNIRGFVFLPLFLALPFLYLYLELENIWILLLAIAMLFYAFFVLPYHLQRTRMGDVQKRRDEQASAILAAVCKGQNVAEFILFLRPFSSTGHLGLSEQQRRSEEEALWDASGSDAESQLPAELSHGDFESLLADEFWPPAILGLGKPGEHFGVSRLPDNENNWQSTVSSLIQHASSVIAIPSIHAGTLWELEQIVAQDYIHKCIFFVEPTSATNESEWSQTCSAFTQLGLYLPANFRNDTDKQYIGSLVKCFSGIEACIRLDIGYRLELSGTKTKLSKDMLSSLCSQEKHASLQDQIGHTKDHELSISFSADTVVRANIHRR